MELLKAMAPISDIAKLLGLSGPTFRKYFKEEILSVRIPAQPAKPPRKITEEMREKVKRYVGCKMPIAKIALVMGYEDEADLATFKSDFQREIEIGDAVYRAKVLDKLHDQMNGGVLGATTKLEALTQISTPGDAAPAQQSSGYVSKKDAAKADATANAAAGGKFAPRTPPRLAVVGGQNMGNKSA